MIALLGILYFVFSACFGLGCTASQIFIVLNIIKSVKANTALKADPSNALLAETAKKHKKNLIIWICAAVACLVLVLCTYFLYIILLAIFAPAGLPY